MIPVPEANAAGGNEITRDDLDEFNVNAGGYGATLAPTGSRMSLSSYNSRTTRGTSANRASAAQRQAPTSFNATVNSTRAPQDSLTSQTAPGATVRRSRAEQSHDRRQREDAACQQCEPLLAYDRIRHRKDV